MNDKNTIDFGYEKVNPDVKTRRVGQVFDSVAKNYDVMNDLMSFGVHRLWKRHAVLLSNVRRGDKVLDVAGGTGDMALLYMKEVGPDGSVIISDINNLMLVEGREQLVDRGIINGPGFVQANAECLPFINNTFDCVSIAFGLRNVTYKEAALKSMYEKLKYGGCIIILEFSKVVLPLIKQIYDSYSFNIIPEIGKFIAHDRGSYQYLVESIRMHPDQDTLKNMMQDTGFDRVEYYNLSGGIVAIHKGYKI